MTASSRHSSPPCPASQHWHRTRRSTMPPQLPQSQPKKLSRSLWEHTEPPLASFPPHDLQQAAAFSFPFPTDFLLQSNGTGLVADTTSTGESLGVLIPIITNPHRCVGKSLHFHIDNTAVVYGFKKRRCNDKLAHSIIRAAYIVAGALGCKIFVSWVPRRSNNESVIADDLTHMDFSNAQALDKHTFRSVQPFPPPITAWMKNPSHDRDLGHNILSWMRETYQNLL